MIFLMSSKFFDNHKKKLVQPKDYIITDATDDESAKLNDLSNVITQDNLAVPPKLIHLIAEDDDDFGEAMDIDRIKALEDQFFYGREFRMNALALMRAYVGSEDDNPSGSHELNIFLVVRTKAYKYWKNKYKKAFAKILPDSSTFFKLCDDWGTVKVEIEDDLDSSDRLILRDQISKVEKQMEKEYKKVKKTKKKKKKKNKWKLDGYGFEKLEIY